MLFANKTCLCYINTENSDSVSWGQVDLEVQKNVNSGNKDNSDMIYHKLWTE